LTRNSETVSRRSFLGWLFASLFAFVSALVLVPIGAFGISPALKKPEKNWVEVTATKDIKAGEPTQVTYEYRKVDGWVTTKATASAWVVTKDGKEFKVFNPHCTHLGCPYHWAPSENLFVCPCHTGKFDIDGNVTWGPPPRPLDRIEYKIEGDKLYVLAG